MASLDDQTYQCNLSDVFIVYSIVIALSTLDDALEINHVEYW